MGLGETSNFFNFFRLSQNSESSRGTVSLENETRPSHHNFCIFRESGLPMDTDCCLGVAVHVDRSKFQRIRICRRFLSSSFRLSSFTPILFCSERRLCVCLVCLLLFANWLMLKQGCRRHDGVSVRPAGLGFVGRCESIHSHPCSRRFVLCDRDNPSCRWPSSRHRFWCTRSLFSNMSAKFELHSV